jgi:hypothetical protein
MKITALKTGRFAHPVVSEPQIEVVEGKEYDVDTQIGTALIDCKWAEEVKAVRVKAEPEKKSEPKPKARKKKVKKGK